MGTAVLLSQSPGAGREGRTGSSWAAGHPATHTDISSISYPCDDTPNTRGAITREASQEWGEENSKVSSEGCATVFVKAKQFPEQKAKLLPG